MFMQIWLSFPIYAQLESSFSETTASCTYIEGARALQIHFFGISTSSKGQITLFQRQDS